MPWFNMHNETDFVAAKTHGIVRKMFSRKLVPKEEVRDSMGNLVVYKGFCLLPR
jgi:hypothetical protein